MIDSSAPSGGVSSAAAAVSAAAATNPVPPPAIAAAPAAPPITMIGSPGLANWLQQQQLALGFTTYQTNRLFLIGTTAEGRLSANERLFDKPMGLYASDTGLWMSTRYQLWQFENCLAPGEQYQGGDRLYVPSTAHTTGDLNVHDVVLDHQQRLIFINTDFSCLATLRPGYSFVPLWQPPFISKLVAEDRCHLNGLAMVEGEPTYVTACSTTDEAAGWRDHRSAGGVVIHVPSSEIIATDLSMPHSPRWYQGKLWLLNSGTGELGYLDGDKFAPLTFCPGFGRGLAFWQHFALVGLSKLRSRSFGGLALEERLAAQDQEAQCGLLVIDLRSGAIVEWLHLDGVVEELFDVVVLPGVRQPKALGFQSEDIQRLITFPGSKGVVLSKPTVKRPSVGATPPVPGLPQPEAGLQPSQPASPTPTSGPLKYQRVYHLNPENLRPYDAMTFPSLQQRWQTQPQRGELVAISASVAGEMVGLAIAEQVAEHTAELLSLFVLPAYRQHGIGTKLMQHLERSLSEQGYRQMQLSESAPAEVPPPFASLLRTLGWQPSASPSGRSHKHLEPSQRRSDG